MPPKKDKEDEEHPRSSGPKISFSDLEKSMTTFTGDDTYPISSWVQEFEDTADVMEWTKIEKLVYGKRLLDGTARLFLRSLGSVKDWETLKKYLLDEFSPKLNSAIVHKKLASRKMKNEETFQQYFLHMREIALHASVEDDALIEYVIDGIRDSETNKAILYGARDIKEFRAKLDSYSNLRKRIDSKNSARQNNSVTASSSAAVTGRKSTTKRCFNCGDTDHLAPACTKGVKCFRCNEYGHKGTECLGKPKKTLNIHNKKEEKTPFKKIKINGIEMTALIDTGSDVNLIKTTQLKRFEDGKPKYENNPKICLTGIGKKEINTEGYFTAKLQIDDCFIDTVLHVVEDETIPVNLILGNPILHDLNINFTSDGITVEKITHLTLLTEENNLRDDLNIGDTVFSENIKKIIKEYKINEAKKESNVEMKIVLTDETPIYQQPRRLSPLEKEIVNKQIEEWTEQKIIKPSNSDFASPVVLAKKKNGQYRLCIDYRRLNKKVIKERFPLPLIEDQLDRLKDAKLFTSLDLRNGFLQVNVHKDSQKYTSFVTPQGQYQFTKMPFGLCTAPSIFQRFINNIFQDLISKGVVLAYLDDLIIPSKTEEEGLLKLKEVLKRAEEFGLEFNWLKCHFMKKEIQYLGYIISNKKVQPSKEKVNAVSKFKVPKDIKSLQSFLGLTGYFRKFIKNYSLIARPLTDLLKKNVEFYFDESCEKAFIELKNILCSSPVLSIYNPTYETELHTDASAKGFGAVLLQRDPDDNQMHPVHFMSKKTSPTEEKYHSYYLEILAIAEAIKKFRVYLLGIQFKIVTDCTALTMTLQKKDLPPRVARWALLLEEYDYVIEHRPGLRLKHADALSRYPVCFILTETTLRIKKAQEEDAQIDLLKRILEKEPFKDYIIENGILIKEKDGRKLIVVPKKMQYDIIRKNHEKGHFSIEKTEELINREYFIEDVKRKIRKVIDNCIECILISHKRGKKEGHLHPIDKGDVPLSTYHIDHLGPLTSTNKNYKYILTIVDGFTKFTWIYPVKTLTTEETLSKLTLQQQTFGAPHRIISDRNAAFTSNEFKKYCEEENIVHYTITTGQPRGNGQVERIHQIIIEVLSKLSIADPTKWYRNVAAVQRAINGTFQRSIGMTPFELLIGVKMKDKNDEILKLIEEESIASYSENRSELRRKAKESIQKIQDENRRSYNKNRKEANQYEIGDLVAIKRTQFTQGSKLYPKFLGPYEVVQKKRNDRYEVRKVGHGEGPINTTSSADLMKRWMGQDSDTSGSDE